MNSPTSDNIEPTAEDVSHQPLSTVEVEPAAKRDTPHKVEPVHTVEDTPHEVKRLRVKHIYARTAEGTEARFFPHMFQAFNNQIVRLVGTLVINGVKLGSCDIQAIALFSSLKSNQDHIQVMSVVSQCGRRLRVHGKSNVGCNLLQDLCALFPLLPVVDVNVETREML